MLRLIQEFMHEVDYSRCHGLVGVLAVAVEAEGGVSELSLIAVVADLFSLPGNLGQEALRVQLEEVQQVTLLKGRNYQLELLLLRHLTNI